MKLEMSRGEIGRGRIEGRCGGDGGGFGGRFGGVEAPLEGGRVGN